MATKNKMAFRIDFEKNPKITADWSKVKNKNKVKDIVGGVVVDAILNNNSNEMSSVKHRGKFKPLSKDYKDKKKALGKGTKANLELFGKMGRALEFKKKKDAIDIGIFRGKLNLSKADGHNNHSGDSSLPPRKFIPKQGREDFKPDFYKAINSVLKDNIDAKD